MKELETILNSIDLSHVITTLVLLGYLLVIRGTKR